MPPSYNIDYLTHSRSFESPLVYAIENFGWGQSSFSIPITTSIYGNLNTILLL